MFQFYGYLVNVAGVNIDVNIAIIERFTFHDVAIILGDMRTFFVS